MEGMMSKQLPSWSTACKQVSSLIRGIFVCNNGWLTQRAVLGVTMCFVHVLGARVYISLHVQFL
jgi:hypothetical protein